jgi:hypothetical protein
VSYQKIDQRLSVVYKTISRMAQPYSSPLRVHARHFIDARLEVTYSLSIFLLQQVS